MPRGSSYIRQARQKLCLSQLQAAVRADVSVRTFQFAESGKGEVTIRTLNRIAEALELSPQEVICDDEALQQDQLQLHPWSISGFIQKRTQLPADSFCHDEATARRIIFKMRESWKLHLDSAGTGGRNCQFAQADRQLNEQVDQYVERYLAIWRACPEAIRIASGGDEEYGASVVLPVTDSAFARLESGEISFMEIGPNEILYESQNLVLDSLVEFSGTGHPAWHKLTSMLSYVVFCQMATLCQAPNEDSFRMISFSASPLNLERLLSTGFQEIGVTMPDFGYSICLFSTDESQQHDERYARASTTAHFSHLVKGICEAGAKVSDRRKVIKKSLSMLRKFVPRSEIDTGLQFDLMVG